jgi:response regulator of citrate/malate metabolism
MNIREILHSLRENHSDRCIAKALTLNRGTLQRYRAWALTENLLTGELPIPNADRAMAG